MDNKTLAAYLARIGAHAAPCPRRRGRLRALHPAHLHAVPFENLSIHLGQAIVLRPGRRWWARSSIGGAAASATSSTARSRRCCSALGSR